jgi:hypothetical protein
MVALNVSTYEVDDAQSPRGTGDQYYQVLEASSTQGPTWPRQIPSRPHLGAPYPYQLICDSHVSHTPPSDR